MLGLLQEFRRSCHCEISVCFYSLIYSNLEKFAHVQFLLSNLSHLSKALSWLHSETSLALMYQITISSFKIIVQNLFFIASNMLPVINLRKLFKDKGTKLICTFNIFVEDLKYFCNYCNVRLDFYQQIIFAITNKDRSIVQYLKR